MPTWEVLITFFGVALLLGLSPGPDNLFVLAQSAQRGWRVGLCVVLEKRAPAHLRPVHISRLLKPLFAGYLSHSEDHLPGDTAFPIWCRQPVPTHQAEQHYPNH